MKQKNICYYTYFSQCCFILSFINVFWVFVVAKSGMGGHERDAGGRENGEKERDLKPCLSDGNK